VSALTPDLVNNLYDIYIQLLLMLADKFMEQRGHSDPEPLFQAVRDLRGRITAADASIEEVIEGGMGIMRKCYPIVNNPYLEGNPGKFPSCDQSHLLPGARTQPRGNPGNGRVLCPDWGQGGRR